MACVDKSDNMTNTYSFSRETLKWTKRLFMQILDLILWTDLPYSPPVFHIITPTFQTCTGQGPDTKKGMTAWNSGDYIRIQPTD